MSRGGSMVRRMKAATRRAGLWGLNHLVPQRPYAYAYAAFLDAIGEDRGPHSRLLSTGLVRGPSKELASEQTRRLAERLRDLERDAAGAGVIDAIVHGADAGDAFVVGARQLLATNDANRARALGQALRERDGFHETGAIIAAMVLLHDGIADSAWDAFLACDRDSVRRLAPVEFLRAGFKIEPATALVELRHLLDHGPVGVTDSRGWLLLAGLALIERDEAAAEEAIDRAETLVGESHYPTIRTEVEWMRNWLGRMELTHGTSEPGAISFGVVDYKQPDFSKSSQNLGDYVQTVAALGHLVRHQNFEFVGDAGLDTLARELQKSVKPERRLQTGRARFSLTLVQRDGSHFHAVPPRTWMLAFGWYKHPTFDVVRPLMFHENVRPILISVHINVPEMLTPEAIGYLKKYGPVGCRDWNTVHLLLAAGVPAFFSGCLTTTVDTVFPPPTTRERSRTVVVDTNAPQRGDRFTQQFLAVRTRPFLENMRHALEVLEGYRTRYGRVITSRLHSYLPARSLGARVDFRPKNPADPRFDGLGGINDAEFEAMRQGILQKLSTVLSALASGASEDEVYRVWRDVCAADVEAARRRHEDVSSIPEPSFDIVRTCRDIRSAQVDRVRTVAVPGDEIHIEMSLDGNLREQLLVAVQSILRSTRRPVHFWVLSRDHGPSDFDRVARLFPQATFSWLPTDAVRYGEIHGMIRHITIATMDRLLLPSLLPELDRIIHFDIDALCRSDIGELYDLDMEGHAIAGRMSPQPDARSGFAVVIAAAQRLRNDPTMARDLIRRSHNRHAFDFDSFNAGILVLDLARMRSDDFCRQFIPYAEMYGLHDQEILNQYAGGKIREIGPLWNAIPRFEAVTEAKIIHWAGYNKPWGPVYVTGQHLYDEVSREVSELNRSVLAA